MQFNTQLKQLVCAMAVGIGAPTPAGAAAFDAYGATGLFDRAGQ